MRPIALHGVRWALTINSNGPKIIQSKRVRPASAFAGDPAVREMARSTALTVLVIPAIYVLLRDDGKGMGAG